VEKIRIEDKEFTIAISAEAIQKRVSELGNQLSADLNGRRPLFIVVLNGAFLFAADLLKSVSIECEITFVRVSSYSGTESGQVKSVMWLADEIKDRTVVLVEDIVDTGKTVNYILEEFKKQSPKEIRIISLLHKPVAMVHDLKLDYIGFEVQDKFLVGYGLDYNGVGRNFNEIYELV
jgi:hypoxanthine phosphoribosyltransferase